jgi:hypothetical protein
MVAFNHTPFAPSLLRRLGVWLWLVCLVAGATGAVVLYAPQILDQYTSGRD